MKRQQLWLVKDTALNRNLCTEKKAVIIALIYPYQLKLTPAPVMSKSPVQSNMQGVNHIIILKVGTDAKFDRHQVIIRYHALKEWKDKFCSKATILKHNLEQELPKDREAPRRAKRMSPIKTSYRPAGPNISPGSGP